MKLSDQAKEVLLTAKWSSDIYFIERQLGYETWRTKGEKGKRKDIAELYRNGLIAEWFTPWSRPCYVTPKGQKILHQLRDEAEEDRMWKIRVCIRTPEKKIAK